MKKRRFKLPTDRQILRVIFDKYEPDYPGSIGASGRPANDPYIDIKIDVIATQLRMHPHLLFGRLYYDLENKYMYYKEHDKSLVHLFNINVDGKHHAVNFPYLSGILARHDEEFTRQSWTRYISVAALVVSVASFGVAWQRAKHPESLIQPAAQIQTQKRPQLQAPPLSGVSKSPTISPPTPDKK